MSDSIKVSIIVPIYNLESYIEKCITSLQEQTLNDIEILVVDDGSTDNSRKIVEELKNDKIKLFKKNNSGVADARNYALKYAKGEYIGFVDGDDYVEPDMFEKMYNKAKSDNADIVCCKYDRIHEKNILDCDIGVENEYRKKFRGKSKTFELWCPLCME